jgi:predicted permease
MGHDLRSALRAIVSQPWHALAITAALGLGIGLNTMIFTLVYAVMYKAPPVPQGSRLVIVAERNQRVDRLPASYPDFLDYRSQSTLFTALEAGRGMNAVISEPDIPPQRYSLEQVSSGTFAMIHAHPILGRGLLASDAETGAAPVVVLSHGLWKQRYGGAANIVGRVVGMNGTPATVVGVMPEGFSFPSGVDVWMPLVPGADLRKRSNRSVDIFGILKPGISMQRANVELQGISHRLAAAYPEADKGVSAAAMTFNAFYNGPQIDTMFLSMLVAVGLVLLIVCANVANMMLSRVLMRQQELSIRVALGASRWRVMRQVLIESLMLSVLGGGLGLGLAAYGVHWFDMATQNVGKPTWIIFTIDPTVFGYFAVLCVLAGLMAGLAPALRASRADLSTILKEGTRGAGTRRGGWLSGLFIVFQFALTLVLLTGAGIFVRAFLAAQTVNPFVPSGQLLTGGIALPSQRYPNAAARVRFFDQLLPPLGAIPGVSQAVIASSLPGLGGVGTDPIEIEGEPVSDPQKGPTAAMMAQSPGYFDAIRLALLRGRDFNASDGAPGREAAIVTRAFAAHFWAGQAVLGKRFRVYDDNKYSPWLTVIGVSGDMVQQPQSATQQPLFFVPYRQEGWDSVMVVLSRTSGHAAALALPLRAAVQKLDPDLPVTNTDTLAEMIHHNRWYLRVFGGLFGLFALTGLFIASIGIYAVMAQATVNRTREIGVRMALGASPGHIARLVMARGMKQLLLGLLIGLAAAYPAARVMASLPLGVSASDPVLFLTVSVLLIGVGLFACYLPARRAAALDPAKAIRYE